MKIAYTGNPTYGLAQAWSRRVAGTIDVKNNTRYETHFFSRANSYNFDDPEARHNFAKVSLEYDVVINSSALHNFQQTLLLKQVWDVWNEQSKVGRIINIGSTADRSNSGTDWIYPTEKKALREFSLGLSMMSVWQNHPTKVSYISFGSLQTSKVHKKHPDRTLMDLTKAVSIIKQVVDQDKENVLSEYRIDPVQIK
jgi:short-subunit dehydrogenase|tara:strand:- start:176 stop:766 length:591 start_codon:yes stop_codon:yes gene_type:complete